mgnify:CR=1 FL=1
MNHSDKYVARNGGFTMIAGQDTNTLNANIIGSGRYFAIEVIEAATFSILDDFGATALGSGTAGTNYGQNITSSDSNAAGKQLWASTDRGFTRIALTAGIIYVYRIYDFQN